MGFESLTRSQYDAWKRKGLSDLEVMEKVGCKNKRALLKWKRARHIPKNSKRYQYLDLDIDEIREMRISMSYRKIAKHFGLTYPSFYDWIQKQRKNGVWL